MSELVTDAEAEELELFKLHSSGEAREIIRLLHTRSALIEALEKIKATTPPTEFAYEIARQLLSTIHATEGPTGNPGSDYR